MEKLIMLIVKTIYSLEKASDQFSKLTATGNKLFEKASKSIEKSFIAQ